MAFDLFERRIRHDDKDKGIKPIQIPFKWIKTNFKKCFLTDYENKRWKYAK